MKKKYTAVIGTEFGVLVEALNRHVDCDRKNVRKFKAASILYGVAMLMTLRIVAKQEEAICQLTARVKELEDIHTNGPVTVENAEILD